MSYNGSGTFQINTSGQPVVTGTSISSTVFNALTADLATGLSTAITKDGQTTTTAQIPFALGINSTLVTDATNTTSGSIITAGGVGIAKNVYVGSAVKFVGATSGSVGLQAKAVAGSTTFKLPSADGTSNQAMVTDGSGNLSFATIGATPGGSTTQVQYNNAGAFGGISGATTNGTALTLTGAILNGTIGATTPSTGAFTTVSATGRATFSPPASFDAIAASKGTVEAHTSYGNALAGNGSSYDLMILNRNGQEAFGVVANTQNVVAAGTLKGTSTISVGGATPSTSGAGITFPATQSASSDANTLDDYEEGTWTPTLITTGTNFTSVTYNAVTSGKYTKIGNMVYVQGIMETTAVVKGAASGFPLIGGLPFSKASDNQYGMFAAMQRSGWSTNVPNTGIVSATTIYLQYTTAANGATSYSAISDISTTTNQIYFGACYNV